MTSRQRVVSIAILRGAAVVILIGAIALRNWLTVIAMLLLIVSNVITFRRERNKDSGRA